MDWTDRGLVLGARPFGESAVILELMTRDHGRHLGLVHGGMSRKARPLLQAGNVLHATWRARLDEQLGSYTVEAEALYAAGLLGSPAALYGLAALAAHLRCLPERDPHPLLCDAAIGLVEQLPERDEMAASFVMFELLLLAELGFGLDLSCCAATGGVEDLAYVSPRTGRAVSREAGKAYHDRLLPLPPFLREEESARPGADQVADGFKLTGFFLDAHLYASHGRALPEERGRFLAQVARGSGEAASATILPTEHDAN